jgi:flagellar basal body-associated protein FliL
MTSPEERRDERVADREMTQDKQADSSERLTKILLFAAFVLCMAVIGLAFLVQGNNRNLDELNSSVDRVDEATGEVQTSVNRLVAFVDEIEAAESDPSSQAQQDAISRAVAMVPEIRDILCEQFPDARACQG